MTENTFKDPLEAVTNALITKSAQNFLRLTQINEKEANLKDCTESFKQTLVDSHQYLAHDLTDILAVQARILDAAFMNVVDTALNKPYGDKTLETALKFQKQTVRTALAWKTLKTDVYIQQKSLKFFNLEKNRVEQTEQNA